MYKKHEIDIIRFSEKEMFIACGTTIDGGSTGYYDDSDDNDSNGENGDS